MTLGTLLLLAVVAVSSAVPLFTLSDPPKCVYSTQKTLKGKDINRCPDSCAEFTEEARLEAGNWFHNIYLYCDVPPKKIINLKMLKKRGYRPNKVE